MIRIHLAYRNIRRMRQIVTVLIKHGFYPFIDKIRLTKVISAPQRLLGKKASMEHDAISLPVRTRLVFEELGPTFIKFGQILSTRPDLIPEEFMKEFLKLQDEVPPFAFPEVIKMIESEFKRPAKELFQHIEEEPVAAASVAQVHRAITTSGNKVVVKVQRPDIAAIIDNDIAILKYISRLVLKYIPESRIYDPLGMVDEFCMVIKKEMDFTLEASYIEKFRKSHADDPRVIIPGVSWDLTGRRVLTMERVEGIKIDRVEELRAAGIDTVKISHIIAEVLFRQVFEFGLFHGDLHSGNIFVAGPEKVGFVDFGIVGRLDRETQENIADIFLGVVKEDYELLTKVYLKMGILPANIDERAFKHEYQDVLTRYFGKPFKMASFGELLLEYIRLASRYNVRLPRELLVLDKAILELEGLGKVLNPEVNVLGESQPFAERLFLKRLEPAAIAQGALDVAREYQLFTKNFPSQIGQILKKMVNDTFTIDFMHRGLEDFMGEMDRSSNRLTFGVIIGSLIIGSSLIMAFAGGDYPILGISGFVIAALMGLWLAFLILKSGKL